MAGCIIFIVAEDNETFCVAEDNETFIVAEHTWLSEWLRGISTIFQGLIGTSELTEADCG